MIIHRYKSHHVRIDAAFFVMEHPLTCPNLSECDLYERALYMWDKPPAELGWWKVNDDLSVSEPEERSTYEVREVIEFDSTPI